MAICAPILQESIPPDQIERAAARLPSVAPVDGPWLRMDEAYGAQMAERRRLLRHCKDEVYAQLDTGLSAARALLEEVLDALPEGFAWRGEAVECQDGAVVALNWDAPLYSLGHILQQDVCILEKQGGEHVLTGAALCFPASWTLAQKIGHPLVRIHAPVTEYEDSVAKRVQRLFDGVKPGRPIWRANLLRYDDPTLFQPRTENDPRPIGKKTSPYLRSERQTIMKLSVEGAVAFVIHTTVVADGSGQQDPQQYQRHST